MATDRKYQIFISSTYQDLKEQRAAVAAACLRQGHIPIGMEQFNATDRTQWEAVQKAIDLCDYYAVIVADRYGSIVKGKNGISYTECEYNYAQKKKIPTTRLLLAPKVPWPRGEPEETPAQRRRLAAFRKRLETKMSAYWSNTHELALEFTSAIAEMIESNNRPGWVRSTDAHGPEVVAEIARLSRENDELRKVVSATREIDAAGIADTLSKTEVWPAKSPEGHLDLWTVFLRVGSSLRRGEYFNALARILQSTPPLKGHKSFDKDFSRAAMRVAIEYMDALNLVDVTMEAIGPSPIALEPSQRTEFWTFNRRGLAVYRYLQQRRYFENNSEAK